MLAHLSTKLVTNKKQTNRSTNDDDGSSTFFSCRQSVVEYCKGLVLGLEKFDEHAKPM